jgi:hypothetical protein
MQLRNKLGRLNLTIAETRRLPGMANRRLSRAGDPLAAIRRRGQSAQRGGEPIVPTLQIPPTGAYSEEMVDDAGPRERCHRARLRKLPALRVEVVARAGDSPE